MEHTSSLSAFLDMGGYGFVVWPSYALAALFVIGFGCHSIIKSRKVKKQQNKLASDC